MEQKWKNLIKTPSFIADHLHHFSHQNPSLLLQRIGRNGSMHLYLLDRESQLLEFPTQFLEFQKMDDLSDAKIICSSHGLLCVEIGKYRTLHHSVLLWNPAIREIREVHRTIKDFESYYSFGFGFSPIVKDYKIVKTYAARFHKGVKQVEVYSLSTGSWKEIELGNLERVTLLEETVTVNGVMYWVGIKLDVGGGDKDGNKVVSFDMATEVFTLMPCPAVDIDSSPAFKLTAYDNKLAVLNLPYIGTSESSSFDLWIMEECASHQERDGVGLRNIGASPIHSI
ncbi:F-box/kelch-repeat protein At3g06240-like [Prosopis cineraria]|uniref:F-box/kelch-repeat protein At3g06240-like n=1 Tax=Prosopis cineraria TaxID=364024 RepID=UPI00240EEDCE|nr:F-box/kelch-repeat protein At3g06240-like [Prosopis cineraria]